MKNMKVIIIIALVIFAGCAWWFFTAEVSTSNRQLGVENRFKNKTGNITPIEEPSKTESYQKEVQEVTNQIEAETILEKKAPENLTSTMQKALKTNSDKSIADLKADRVKPTYNGGNYTSAFGTEDDAEEPLKIAAASVPKKEKKPVKETPTKVDSTVTRKSRFNTRYADQGGSKTNENITAEVKNSFKAAVYGDHNVKSGGIVRFRSLEEITIEGIHFPRNTIFNGAAAFGADRINIVINRIPLKQGGFVSTNMIVHDQDMNAGIYAPLSPGKEAATDEVYNGLGQAIASSGTVVGQVGNGLSGVLRATTQGTQKVAIADAYPVIFMINEKQH